VLAPLAAGLLLVPGIGQAQESGPVADTAGGPITKASNGASATCTVPSDLSRIDCTLSDTKSDKHPVFISWSYDGEDAGRFTNNGGNDTTTSHGSGQLKQGLTPTLSWKVCTDKQLRGDSCSEQVDFELTSTGIPIEIHCQGFNRNNPPSASIPPEAQPQLNCYQVGESLASVPIKCITDVIAATIGVGESVKKFVAKKVPGVGLGAQRLRRLVGLGRLLIAASVQRAECALIVKLHQTQKRPLWVGHSGRHPERRAFSPRAWPARSTCRMLENTRLLLVIPGAGSGDAQPGQQRENLAAASAAPVSPEPSATHWTRCRKAGREHSLKSARNVQGSGASSQLATCATAHFGHECPLTAL
jgi:hypothetical protein